MRRGSAALVLVVVSLATNGTAAAQGSPDAISAALSSLSDDAPIAAAEMPPLVLHVHPDLDALSARLLRSVARRIDTDAELGGAPPGGLCVAIEPGSACVAPLEEHDTRSALVIYRGEDGRFFETEIALEEAPTSAVRALAIALVDVREAARTAPPIEAGAALGPPDAPRLSGSSWVYVEREGGLFGRRRSIESIARPILYLRLVLGPTSARSAILFGPGVGLGLCVGDFCAVLEGDIPVIEEHRQAAEMGSFGYRPVYVAARLGYRPLRAGPVVAGITWGLIDRFGNAWRDGTDETQLVTDLGMRQSIELAIDLGRPWEWVFEVGLDVTFAPARWQAGSQGSVVLTDDVTGWGVTALRIRP